MGLLDQQFDLTDSFFEVEVTDSNLLFHLNSFIGEQNWQIPESYKPKSLEAVSEKRLLEIKEKSHLDKNSVSLPFTKASEIGNILTKLFKKQVNISGNGSWYPPGGYLGWHTNKALPGWRVYLTYAQEPNRSFFRYQDTVSGEIKTAYEEAGWQMRRFRILAEEPLWHCVYSEDTNRYSVGWNIIF